MTIRAFPLGRVDGYLISITFGDGVRHVFVDAGFRSNGLTVVKKLKALNITHLDVYVGTHGHRNHIEGAAPIIAAFKPDSIYVPREAVWNAIKKYAKTAGEKKAMTTAIREGRVLGIHHSGSFKVGDVEFKCIGPLSFKRVSVGTLSENHNSMILKAITPAGNSFLMTGDTSATILRAVAKKYDIKSTVLKNPHHNGALPADVLKKIAPKHVIVCNSSRPSSTYRKRIKAVGAVLHTACPVRKGGNGTVILNID